MTFGDLKSYVEMALLDVYPDRLNPDLVADWVQQAYVEVDTALRWSRDKEEDNSVIGQANYAIPTTTRVIVFATYLATGETKATLLKQISIEEWHRLDEADGTPTSWARWGDEIYLYPTPDVNAETITLFVSETPTALATDVSIPVIPAETHGLIRDYALMEAYAHLGDTMSMRIYQDKFERGVAKFIGDVSEYRSNRIRVSDVEPF